MINLIWLLMIVCGVLVAIAEGRVDVVTAAAFSGAANSLTIVLEMTGVIMLWMGILKLAEASGLIAILGKLLRPVVKRLFPDLSPDSPALGSIVMNISANLLGLGNAATPFGIKAMEELQKSNPDRTTANDAMITFLILNTSSFTLIPTMVISLRTQAGSAAPEEVILPAILAAAAGLVAGLAVHRLIKRYF